VRRRALLLTGLGALMAPRSTFGEIPPVLRISAIPDENPTELMRIYTPFADYLARELRMKVDFTPVVDYAATVEGLAAFGSVSSTSGHLMPRYFLLKQGIRPEQDFKQVAYSGAHDATALWVESGKVDAGALNFLVWDKLVQQKKVDRAKVDVFETTPPYVDYVWTARGELDPGLRERITSAFLKLDYADPEHRRLLDLHRTKKYIRANDADWKSIEEAAVAAGLLK
jgi:phosphonate transport system substrate-binding protein